VCMSPTSEQPARLLSQAISISEGPEATEDQKNVLPALYVRKGVLLCNACDMPGSKKAYEICLKLLQDRPALTLFPHGITEVPLKLVREQHLLHVDALLGITTQYVDLCTKASIPRLRRYVDGTQRDAPRFYQTHYDLAEAMLVSAQNEMLSAGDANLVPVSKARDIAGIILQVDDVIQRAERYKNCHLPTVPPPTEAEYPKIAEVKGILSMMKMGLPLEAAATSVFSGAREADAGVKEGVKCWGCDKEARLVCSRCKTAKFCGAECQRRTWKTHKIDCNAMSGCAATR
jgi:hypothetical protein